MILTISSLSPPSSLLSPPSALFSPPSSSVVFSVPYVAMSSQPRSPFSVLRSPFFLRLQTTIPTPTNTPNTTHSIHVGKFSALASPFSVLHSPFPVPSPTFSRHTDVNGEKLLYAMPPTTIRSPSGVSTGVLLPKSGRGSV